MSRAIYELSIFLKYAGDTTFFVTAMILSQKVRYKGQKRGFTGAFQIRSLLDQTFLLDQFNKVS
jgi:hypothetical protein